MENKHNIGKQVMNTDTVFNANKYEQEQVFMDAEFAIHQTHPGLLYECKNVVWMGTCCFPNT